MNFYKVIKENMIVGVCTNDSFRRYQAKHRIIIVSDSDRVEAVDCDGIFYHDTWMATPRMPSWIPAAVALISERERITAREDLTFSPPDFAA